MGVREYYDYHCTIYGDITDKAIVIDSIGTLLTPT
jgi:hypothetical protein